MVVYKHPSSFRDPSGFIFTNSNGLYRQINTKYKKNYDRIFSSGLYDNLVNEKLLIAHSETDVQPVSDECYKIIKPQLIPFISYPYEWSFSQLKDAALTTLKIQKIAINFGMSLKDCSAYNIQFNEGKPIFIDTLSFEEYEEGLPWVGYKQFCQHFLSPLALMSYKDIRLNQLFRIYIDGIPIDLASSLLPFHTLTNFSLLSHIHLQSKTQKHFEGKVVKKNNLTLNKHGLLAIIDNLESRIKKLKLKKQDTEWGNYYDSTNYSEDAMENKRTIVKDYLLSINPQSVWDFGANTGYYSRIAGDLGIGTISFDIDPLAVEKNYINCKNNNEKFILPLLLDLTNPSAGIGWANEERKSIAERGPADALLALALIHHLAISNNLPFSLIAEYFSNLCVYLIIEFVPKGDSQVKRLLETRDDIFDVYTEKEFENEFNIFFELIDKRKITNSERSIFLFKKRH